MRTALLAVDAGAVRSARTGPSAPGERAGMAGLRVRMRDAVIAGIAAFLLALVAGPATAQEDPGAIRGDTAAVLTLQDAVAIARRYNPSFRQSVYAVDLNPVESRAAWATQVLPNLDINLLRTGYGGNLTRRAFDNFGRPIEDPTAEWVYNSNTTQGISLNWSIQGLSFLNALRRQERTNADRILTVANRGWVLESEVRRRFLDALEQRELLAVEQDVREARVVDLESAERLFDIAQRTRVDVLTAELEVARQDQNIQEQSRSYDQALLALRSYIGDTELGPVQPAPLEFEVFDPSILDAQALVEMALESNPGLREARAGVSGAELGVQEARESWFPTLSFSFDYGRLAQTRQADAFLDFSPESNDWQSSFSIFLGIPLFNDFFQDRADLARAQVELDSQEETLREQRLEVDRTVRTELINLNNQYQTLLLASRSKEIADEAVRLAREEYRIGTRTTEQLQESVTSAADARRQVIQARYGFADALLALEEALGRRLPPELRGGN